MPGNFDISYTISLIDKLTPQLNKINSQLQQFDSKFAKVKNNFIRYGESFKQFGNRVNQTGKSLLRISAPLGLLTYKAIKGASEWESFNTTFEVLLGSAEKARERLREISKFAIKTPFSLPEVVDLGRQLQALGRYSQENMMMLGDLAAATGKPIRQVSEAFTKLVVGQKGIAAKMFRNLLITSEDWIEATGKGISKNGELLASTEELIRALPKIMEKKGFTGMMIERSKILEGVYSNLLDAMGATFRVFGKSIVDTIKLKDVLLKLIDVLDVITDKFEKLSPFTKKFLSWTVLIGAGLAPVLIIIGQVALGINALIPVIGALGIALKFLFPTSLLSMAIWGIVLLVMKSEWMREKLSIIIDALKEKFKMFFEFVIDWIQPFIVAFEKAFKIIEVLLEKFYGFTSKKYFQNIAPKLDMEEFEKEKKRLDDWVKKKRKERITKYDVSENVAVNILGRPEKSIVEVAGQFNFQNVPKGATFEMTPTAKNANVNMGVNMNYAGGM
jgi:hypothetical protein